LIFGGVGLSRLRRNITDGISFFNLQAVTCVTGFILILLIFTQIGEPRQNKINEKISNLSGTIDSLRIELREIRSEVKHQDSLINHSIPDKNLKKE